MRLAFVALALAALSLAACQKAPTQVAADDMTLGNPKAPVTVIEYASVACPHCAKFNNEVFPAFKSQYIDTGQVFYVAREALTGDPSLAAAGFLLARCAGKSKYFEVTNALYQDQAAIENSGDPRDALRQIANSAGLTDAQFNACITNEKAQTALNNRWNHYVTDYGINSTPTYVINGKTYDKGEMSLAQISAAIAQARKGGS